MTNSCGHEWIVSITQQEEEPDLDQALLSAITELPDIEDFALYVNKHFGKDIPPLLLNPDSSLEPLESQEVNLILQKVAKNKIRISSAFGHYTSYIPTYYLGEVIGVLLVESEYELPERSIMLAVHVLNVYANQLALIHRSRLDPLTELLNRQTFDKKVIEIISGDTFITSTRSSSKQSHWFLALLDIDHFKRVNDNFGHVIGDEVILLVARLIKNSFRIDDFIFRYGGEEFAVLFQASDEHDARNMLNRVRCNVAEYPFPQVNNLTISSGFLALSEIDMVSVLVHKADLALYHSKNNGRNQVTAYTELEIEQEPDSVDDGIELF
ncbi:diguanylate cyclase [Pseudoalteromonas shioyasakiensis]|uniref:GGDEF domain-containing protein n=1 Tax=Pseudoalteromonas shioyasakiensis TaxID=1190813 RepID=UPI0021199D07|nr:diguanylate cyclase [Pseudoalteromonas shioyasakiensis]MCQ8879027.1 diguanylate cyclase [Pseudoalteromonas shioyasakiensis]